MYITTLYFFFFGELLNVVVGGDGGGVYILEGEREYDYDQKALHSYNSIVCARSLTH